MKSVSTTEIDIINKIIISNSNYIVKLIALGLYNGKNFIIMNMLKPLKIYPSLNSDISNDYNGEEKLNEYNLLKYIHNELTHRFETTFNTDIILIQFNITKQTMILIINLINILRSLHKMNILHGDIKQDNLGINELNIVQIFDFGESLILSVDSSITFSDHITSTVKGVTFFQNAQQFYKYYDTYALGKLIINLLTNIRIFEPGRHYKPHRILTQVMYESIICFIKTKLYCTNSIYINHLIIKILLELCNYKFDDYDNSELLLESILISCCYILILLDPENEEYNKLEELLKQDLEKHIQPQ